MEFKKEEIRDFILTILALGLISSIFNFSQFLTYFFIYSISTGLKILAEKYAASKFSIGAKYSFNYNYFIISLVLSIISAGTIVFPILGFIKVEQKEIKRLGKYYSNITSREKGWISIIGVLSNVLMVLISMFLIDVNPAFFQKFIDVNSLILLFSLIPFAKFEGSNILWWNRFLWVAILLCSMFLSFLAIFKINLIISLIFSVVLFIVAFIFWEKTF